ncbi:uncharacterized protein LOC129918399 isoform X3 [Episyrphus balteatus]|uniref:uncharacterized protein LOC129918399 isoform X3 n=1 Tax=Episyrphus balteatus TaxID=286459 RepID=UPI0024854E41|nr:uncharacterized protein LOC129918399 isoform X3 [Episyrphus balteatus]
MSAARSNKYAWIVICLASIFIYLKTDAIPLSSKSTTSVQQSSQPLVDTFLDFDDAFEIPSVSKTIIKRSPDDDDNEVSDDEKKESSSTTTSEKPTDSGFHHGDHGHGHGHTVLKPTHSSHHGHNEDDDDNRNNNSGSGGFNILEFFGTIFRLVWGFVSNIPALLFGSSSSSSSGGQ